MARPSSYPIELRRCVVRIVAEVRGDYRNESAAFKADAGKLGIGSTETLRKWVRQDQVDSGARPGMTTEESAQLKALKKEVAELKRANEILKAAASFFASELDRPHTLFEANYRVYGARKVWRELNRQRHAVARCIVERLMRENRIAGAVRSKKVITAVGSPTSPTSPPGTGSLRRFRRRHLPPRRRLDPPPPARGPGSSWTAWR
ncbi:IS3 family transposase [Streptomyces sp. H27-H1]|uniref:IS3 family transposase n=1 Tax=Streptomyces sp. H27-H1 TaxID=2996461 RepID=UPI00226F3FEE|nr:IS3 family transposase [Streptomyces sp. H27-H1]MCY0932148.1 IS3 family transposase [Streptomyces sp. H27-H1]